MPKVRVDDEVVDVPRFVPGAEILANPVVQEKARDGRTVFLAVKDEDGTSMEIVDPQKHYELRDGTQIETTAPSVSGGR